MKKQLKNKVLAWLVRNADYVEYYDEGKYGGGCFYGKYNGHHIRYNFESTTVGRLDVGHADFDRWANSCAYSSQIIPDSSISKQMNLSIMAARQHPDSNGYSSTLEAIRIIFDGSALG